MSYYIVNERPPSFRDPFFPSFDPMFHPGSSMSMPMLQPKSFQAPSFDSTFLSSPSSPSMKLSYSDETKEYCIGAATPGVKREDLKIEVVGGHKLEITIDHKEGTVVRKGFMSMSLPKDADTLKPRVEYVDGMLNVYFPSTSPEESEKRMRLADAAHADIAKDYDTRCEKVKQLREELEKEMKLAAEVQEKLREARYQEAIAMPTSASTSPSEAAQG
eukprot:CAMPEP_0206276858 /NCGR_PEP_ID=MMETSP0047_2-20121206/36530_1 /ASSEMBLY_ACC=CAM_ASM_000192 /TAXON_ID=195065 /ORGANISM="Chroomonas mesostigmatica_cf, Strain CCMP1168" /LENGTH=216 /DNA_ID=CAMNT_0053706403 /DNA_START=126 /DNA_END=777 /DNA_ORIENTATION=-